MCMISGGRVYKSYQINLMRPITYIQQDLVKWYGTTENSTPEFWNSSVKRSMFIEQKWDQSLIFNKI